MSIPAIRAIRVSVSSALPLLVTWVLADHHDAAVPANDLALLAHLLHAGSDLHGFSLSELVRSADLI
jgi:hypothetical protein